MLQVIRLLVLRPLTPRCEGPHMQRDCKVKPDGS